MSLFIPHPQHVSTEDAISRARRLDWMFFDVDGVMTDGGLYYGPQGESMKRFHVLDGHGIKLLRQAGIRVGIISGRQHEATAVRAKELGMDVVLQGEADKGAAFDRLATELPLDPSRCGHMGDDTPDLALFSRVLFAAAVPNAAPEVIAQAHWIATRTGGNGAVRECCEFILKSRE
jgi:3-deoxy-D-manno-octulosonate 8-phosphate phosphatase (KDO 8-P phosphatase)